MIRAARKRPSGPTYAERVETELLATLRPLGFRGRLWITALLAVCGFALFAYITQILNGLRVTGMRDFVSWGLYMTNFVFFIGISHAGTLISAILRVTHAEWRRPITRMAEAITVFALIVGASMVIIDMGRPDRLLNVVRYGRLSSPILWDVCSITTYLTGSFLYLYVAMIPDMPTLMRDTERRGGPQWLVGLYRALALGYRGTPQQERYLHRALAAMAVIIIPVAVSVHTVVSWVFGMTLRPGWHSTIFGPYFVIGAIFSGTAAIITAMALFRRAYHLERYLTLDHFRKLGALLLALTLLYAYFTFSEYLTTWYGGLATEGRLINLLMGGSPYGVAFWFWAVTGLFVPIGLLIMPGRRSLGAIITASVLINIGMWLKRFLIVVPTLETPWVPAQAAGVSVAYAPTWVEWAITAGGFAGFMLLYTVFSRIFPIISIWETAEDQGEGNEIPQPHPPVRVARPGFVPIRGLLLAVGLGTASLVSAAPSHAQAVGASDVRVELTRASDGDEVVLVAMVTMAGHPLEGAEVVFAVKRTFSPLELGTEVTDSDGRATVPFPSSLPGGPTGELNVTAEILSPDRIAGVRGEAILPGGRVVDTRETAAQPPRALWSARAPVALIATISFLLVVVWSTYVFVVRQLLKIRGDGVERPVYVR